MDDKRLFLLDAFALIYRAYYAMMRSPRVTSSGFNTSAIFGFCNTLDEILRKENPTHIGVCFDPKGPTFRHEEYPEYKAQRDKQPEDIALAVPWIKRILEAYRIPVVEVAGFEADDVIGTLSRMAEAEGFTTYMMTLDKDYGQLVTDRVFMYRPPTGGGDPEVRGPEQVCERYGISSPSQVIDLLALEGDVSDNIPGCPGVGEKTAAKLIAQWGSVDNLLDHVDELKGALRTKVAGHAGQIRFSRHLVTIRTDVPLPPGITPEAMRRTPENADELADIYRQLEFRTFLRRLEGSRDSKAAADATARRSDGFVGGLFDEAEPEPEAVAAPLAEAGLSYSAVTTVAGVADAVSEACRADAVGISVNAFGFEAMTAEIIGIALSWQPGRGVYIILPPDSGARRDMAVALEPLASGAKLLVSGDLKRDMLLLRRLGVRLTAPCADNSVAHYLLDPEMKHTPAYLATKYLGYALTEPDPEATRPSRKPRRIPDEAACRVMCELADTALRLHPLLMEQIEARDMARLLADVELPLVQVLADMEWTGVRVDVAELERLSRSFTGRLDEMEAEIYRLAGTRFNISSPMQVGQVLFDTLAIDATTKRTKKGGYSTTEEILEKLRPLHPIVDLILRYRALRKLLTTYVNALPGMVNPATGKIHTTYYQTVTATGRISSANPNLQNIPIRSDDGREIRRAFIPDPGCLIMSADYSQIELRLMADLSGDPDMIEAFHSGADIHRATAAKIYHEPLDGVTDAQRRNAKTANFGIIYGISAFGLSERLGIPRSEARQLIDGYFASYPRIRAYMDDAIARARADGYVSTIMGRRRMLPDINSRSAVVRGYAERNAINAPIQGSAADIIKVAMVSIARAINDRGLRSRMILQVHDELVFNVVPDELPVLQELVTTLMERAYTGRVRLEVSSGTGRTWLEAH